MYSDSSLCEALHALGVERRYRGGATSQALRMDSNFQEEPTETPWPSPSGPGHQSLHGEEQGSG